MKNIHDFIKMKADGSPISVITCYDYTSGVIVNDSNIDCVLVGDSAANVMHGHNTTVHGSLDMMCFHISAVARAVKDKLLIADMPFLAHRKGLVEAMNAVDRLTKCGAQAVKIEGTKDHVDIIKHIVDSGVPVMGHLGMTPQSVNQFGGFRVQARQEHETEILVNEAKRLQDAGCFGIVLELVPAKAAKAVTDAIDIPTIGIGAGPHTTGQVLVFQDVLGMNKGFKPKFLRTYLDGYDVIKNAINNYSKDVKDGNFPNEKESF